MKNIFSKRSLNDTDISHLKELSTICASKDEVESIQCSVEERGEFLQT